MVNEENNSTNTSNEQHALLNDASDAVASDVTPPMPANPDVNATRINIRQHPTPNIANLTMNEGARKER